MYSSWTSLQSYLLPESSTGSILRRFPEGTGKDVVGPVVRCLAQGLGVSGSEQPSRLITEHEVNWAMEVLCHGLYLPFTEHELVRDCVSVYCEWLTVLSSPKLSVPRAVVDSPGQFCPRILFHLYNVFVPRDKSGPDHVKRQVVLCHRVLRTVQSQAKESRGGVMTRDVWDSLLRVLLAVTDTLIAPPREKDSLGDQLSERVIAVLFEMWLLSCAAYFPVPSLWRTFRDMCGNWRHYEPLVVQWNRVNFALTARLVKLLYGRRELYLELSADDQDAFNELTRDYVQPLGRDCLVQCWFRFLHALGNPADLCCVALICGTPKFKHYALTSSQVIEPSQHECLLQLPKIFLRAVKGVSTLVEALLDAGAAAAQHQLASMAASQLPQQHSTLPPQRRVNVWQSTEPSVASSFHGTGGGGSSTAAAGIAGLLPGSGGSHDRPSCNSLLHVFGAWLFDAAVGSAPLRHTSGSTSSKRKPAGSLLQPPRSSPDTQLAATDHDGSPSAPTDLSFSLGRAEACGVLCRIVRSLRTGETIEPVYLARFYLVLYEALEVPAHSPAANADVLTYCLCNMDGLLCLDLTGVNALLPRLVAALEAVLPGASGSSSQAAAAYPFRVHEHVTGTDLRRSACRLLLAVLCLPLHYDSLEIVDLLSGRPVCTYASLRQRLAQLTFGALKVEADAVCTTALLAGAALLVQDTASYECRDEHDGLVTAAGSGAGGVVDDDAASSTGTVPTATAASAGGSSILGGSGSSHGGSEVSSNFGSEVVPPAGTDDAPSLPPPVHPPPSLPGVAAAATAALLVTSAPMDDVTATAEGLFSAATTVITARLNAQWKLDLSLTLSALEVLTSLSKTRLGAPCAQVCGRVVRSLCDLIVYLCSRPPKNQLRDLHSVIVAALLCLCSWLTEHPEVLQRRDCLHWALEVVELGISGRKSLLPAAAGSAAAAAPGASSVPPPAVTAELKGDKAHMPVSQRVKDAAEVVLESIMDQADAFPCPCGADSLYSTVSERLLLRDELSGGFKYFALGSLVVVGILEDYSERIGAELPRVTVVVRGPFGRQAWCVQPKLQSTAGSTGPAAAAPSSALPAVVVGRPQPLRNPGVSHTVKQRYFPPAAADALASARVESCLPTMEHVIADSRDASEHMTLLLRAQSAFERKMAGKPAAAAADVCAKRPEQHQCDAATAVVGSDGGECRPTPPSKTLQAARMVLSQLGFLSTDALSSSSGGGSGHLAGLSTRSKPSFIGDLEQLDRMPNRTHDTAFVYYVRSGQRSAKDILANVRSKRHVDVGFLEFLGSLGWPVCVDRHSGWTGVAKTSWKAADATPVAADAPLAGAKGERIPSDTGGSAYDGRRWLLYWADCRSEVAFIVPSSELGGDSAVDLQVKAAAGGDGGPLPRSGSGVFKNAAAVSSAAAGAAAAYGDLRVAIVWLERFEDHETFPLSELLLPPEHAQAAATGAAATAPPPPAVTRFAKATQGAAAAAHTAAAPVRDCLVIYVHALRSGLMRVHLRNGLSSGSSVSASLPLADSMVVSQRALGALVRQAVINAGNRRRLECDLSQVPHNRRNAKIQEIVTKYRTQQSEHELLAELFSSA